MQTGRSVSSHHARPAAAAAAAGETMTARLEDHEPSAPVQGLVGRQAGHTITAQRMASNDKDCPKHCTKRVFSPNKTHA